jgi:hypothetical protein
MSLLLLAPIGEALAFPICVAAIPQILDLQPTEGPVGSTVVAQVLASSNPECFGQITFGGVPSLSATYDGIDTVTALVPQLPTGSAPVVVHFGAGGPSSPEPFTVIASVPLLKPTGLSMLCGLLAFVATKPLRRLPTLETSERGRLVNVHFLDHSRVSWLILSKQEHPNENAPD